MIVTLPWPDKRLSPNARMHWAAVAKVKQEARQNAHWAVLADVPADYRELVVEGDGKIPLEITFYPPDNRRRDDDNMVASFKAYRDGLADGLFVDDRRFRPHYIFADAEKPGRIEVFIPNYRTDAAGSACPPCVRYGKGERPAECVNTQAGLTDNAIGVSVMALAAHTETDSKSQAVPFNEAALRVLLAFVAAEPDPAIRADMLRILRADGHIAAEAA